MMSSKEREEEKVEISVARNDAELQNRCSNLWAPNTSPDDEQVDPTRSHPGPSPGAVVVQGFDDESIAADSRAESTTPHLTARVVDTEQEKRVLRENERLRQMLENTAVARAVTVTDPVQHGLTDRGQASTVNMSGDNNDGEIATGGRLPGNLVECGNKRCRWFVVATVLLAAIVVGVVLGVILPRRSGDPSSGAAPQQLIDLLASVSTDGGAALQKPFTAQNKAYIWLSNNANLDSYSDEKKIQRYTLATFYYSTNGDQWKNNTYWLDDGEECGRWWQENPPTLNCSDSGAVVELDFTGNNLVGTIPPEIGLLSNSLEVLDLWANSLIGTIPTEIATLTKLVGFDLADNYSLQGTILSEIGFLTSLVALDFGLNQLAGVIPDEIGQLTKLEQLRLDNNDLTGTVPSTLNRLTNLDLLHLYNNSLSGSFACSESIENCAISCSDANDPMCRVLG